MTFNPNSNYPQNNTPQNPGGRYPMNGGYPQGQPNYNGQGMYGQPGPRQNPQVPQGGNYPPQQYPPRQPQQPPQPPQPPRQPEQSQQPQQPETPEQPEQKKKAKKERALPTSEVLSRIFVGSLCLFVVVYMGWLFAPRIRNSMTFWPTQTPTPVTPTPTIPATMTVTPLATNTPTPLPTATPGPISNYWIANGKDVDPAVPNAPEGVVILSAKTSAEVDPPLDSIYWTSSSQIVQDLGRLNSLYDSEWFATMNSGSIRYFMDRSLNEGLYEIYVMDTYYSSGGSLDFLVKIGDQVITPLTGTQTVTFMTSQYDPRQSMDTWRSLGIYYLMPSRDVLTVSTTWGLRDEYTYVAADRIMIVPRKIIDLALLNQLTETGTKYIMDDTQADILSGSGVFKETGGACWDDSYQLLINPKGKTTIEYNSQEPWPIGTWNLYFYFPESKGGLDAEIQVKTDNKVLETAAGAETVQLHVPTGGSWVYIGRYITDRYYERPVKFSVSITIPEGQSGEYPVDAIAFIHQPFD